LFLLLHSDNSWTLSYFHRVTPRVDKQQQVCGAWFLGADLSPVHQLRKETAQIKKDYLAFICHEVTPLAVVSP
jgi:hypothetical protein